MAAVIQIDILSNILRDVQILHPRLRDEIKLASEELKELMTCLTNKTLIQGLNEDDPQWELRCLKSVCALQDIADAFHVKTLLQKQKGLSKMWPFAGLISSVRNQHVLVKEIKRLTESVGALAPKSRYSVPSHRGSTNASSSKAIAVPRKRVALAYMNDCNEELDLIGFVEEAERLRKFLLENSSQLDVISLLGAPGSGKTTLAKVVYSRKEVVMLFRRCVWVKASEFSILSRDDLIESFDIRARIIPNWHHYTANPYIIENDERILIVIEDVSEMNVWGTIKAQFDTVSFMRIKVLITTCKADIAQKASGSRNTMWLHKLNDKDSWTLFMRKACITEEEFRNSKLSMINPGMNINERILRQSEGSPLAIILLGGLLSTKELSFYEWAPVINEHAKSIGSDHHQSVYSGAFALGFDDLSDDLKSCFIYMAIFPRSFEIPVRRLVHLWTAEGLIRDSSSIGRHLSTNPTLEDVAEEYIKTLVNRSLIEVTQRGFKGRAKKCRLLDTIYDAIWFKSMDLGYCYFHPYSNVSSTSVTAKQPLRFDVRRLVEYSDLKTYPSSDPYIQYIRSYISFNNRRRDTPATEVGTLVNKTIAKRGYGLLSVIDLEGVYKPMLPEAIGKLLKLRYLGLRWTFLDSLPMSVGDLPLLETLDIKHTTISSLSSSIWNAKNLRHMNEIHLDVSIGLKLGESLANLQTLWGLVIGAKSPMAKGLQFLINLRKLGLTCHPKSMEAVVESISQLKNLQSLRLRSIDEHGLPSNLAWGSLRQRTKLTDLYLLGSVAMPLGAFMLPMNLNMVTLSLSKLERDPMPTLGTLPQLRILRLSGNSYIGKTMRCFSHRFPSLYELKLWKLENLKVWKLNTGAMSALRQLEIRCCYKLSTIEGQQQLKALKELTLTNMPEALVKDLKASLGSTAFIKENEWQFSKSSQVLSSC